jgi:GNAT superfamily N-acetyltransferase
MTESFRIRPATPADTPEVFRLIKGLAEYEKLSDMVVGNEAMLGDALFGSRPSCEAMIAEHGGRAVGFALFFTTFSTFLCRPGLYLEDLFVEPGHRGHGIGKAFFREMAKLAASRGCGRFEWRVLDWNAPSIAFYESLGAAIMPEWHLVRMTADEFALLATGGKLGSET